MAAPSEDSQIGVGVASVSYKSDWMDCKSHVRAIEDLLNADFGDHAPSVSAAFVELEQHLASAYRAVRIAMHGARADRATATRDEALAEIERIARGDDE